MEKLFSSWTFHAERIRSQRSSWTRHNSIHLPRVLKLFPILWASSFTSQIRELFILFLPHTSASSRCNVASYRNCKICFPPRREVGVWFLITFYDRIICATLASIAATNYISMRKQIRVLERAASWWRQGISAVARIFAKAISRHNTARTQFFYAKDANDESRERRRKGKKEEKTIHRVKWK